MTLFSQTLTRIIHQEILLCSESFQDKNARETYTVTLIKHF